MELVTSAMRSCRPFPWRTPKGNEPDKNAAMATLIRPHGELGMDTLHRELKDRGLDKEAKEVNKSHVERSDRP